MTAPFLSISRRTRGTPFSARVTAAGVKGYTVYNRMLLPTVFDTLEADYRHLKTHVQVWDVSCERQVEIAGPDAARLAQMLTPRDLSPLQIGQCYYTPVVDESGGMLNDPVMLKLEERRYWVSIADSDLLLWIKGLAVGGGLDVEVAEPAIAPLAVQGPKSEPLMARVFGEDVRRLRFFRFAEFAFRGTPLIVSRSGFSKQSGFEIYVPGDDVGEPLWDALMEAGADLEVRAGCPNLIERVEGGLLSYGNDMTQRNNPFECGMGKFCEVDKQLPSIGLAALARVAETGPARQIRGLRVSGEPLPTCPKPWPVSVAGKHAGEVTSVCWSPDFGTNLALAMIERDFWDPGTKVEVETLHGVREATVGSLPFA